ncbi:MAG TPA: asparagine synthase-related protein [Candidatus Acidoferrales bacterium]|nr:asparagine synthase-related protein [Candidatus Acidoferrales bacterium]
MQGEQDGPLVWFDGEVYQARSAIPKDPGPGDIIALARDGGDELREVDGLFSLACYDPGACELVLANDRFGFRPLYVTETKDFFAYAAEVKALLAVLDKLPAIDEVSLRQFFGFEHMLGERTWWQGIELLPPASLWRFCGKGEQDSSSNGWTKRRYWSFEEIKRDPRPVDDVIEEFGRVWSETVERRARPGTMPLLLSGGIDSRCLLAELREQGADVVAITFGARGCEDMRIAARCAGLAGVPHRCLELTEKNWWEGREESIWQTDGLVNALHHHVVIARNEMHAIRLHSLKSISADVIIQGRNVSSEPEGTWRRNPGSVLLSKYVENPFFSREEVLSASAPDAQRYVEGPSPDCFGFSHRSRRFSIYGGLVLASYCYVIPAYGSFPLLSLVLGSLRDEDRRENRFFGRFLVRRYPRFFRSIPYQRTGRGLLEPLPLRVWRNFAEEGRRRLHDLAASCSASVPGMWRLARSTKPIDRGFADYAVFLNTGAVQRKLLERPLLADDLLQGAARAILQTPVKNHSHELRVLSSVLTLETYLRQVTGFAQPVSF